MKNIKKSNSNLDEYIKGMEDYADSIKDMNKDDVEKSLIRIGVLSPYGKPKEQICTGENYRG